MNMYKENLKNYTHAQTMKTSSARTQNKDNIQKSNVHRFTSKK